MLNEFNNNKEQAFNFWKILHDYLSFSLWHEDVRKHLYFKFDCLNIWYKFLSDK